MALRFAFKVVSLTEVTQPERVQHIPKQGCDLLQSRIFNRGNTTSTKQT